MTEMGAQVARGFRWSMLDTAGQQIVRLGLTIVLTRLVAPDDFGVLAMALVFTQLASLIGDLGLGPALVQRKTVEARHVTTATTVTLAVGVLLALLVFLISAPIAHLYGEPELVAVLQVLSLSYVFRGIAGVPRDLLRRDMRFDLFVISSLVAVGGSGFVALVLAFNGAGVWALVAQTLLESLIGMIVVAFLAKRTGAWWFSFGFDRAAFRELWGFGAFVSGTRFAAYGVSNIDNLIVGKVLGASALGLYNLAYRLMLFPILKVADVVANVMMPALSTMQDDLPRLAAAHRRAIDATSLVVFPVSFGITLAAPVLVPAVFGAAWIPAVATVQILALNGVRLALARLNGAVFQAAGKPKWDFSFVCATLVAYLVAFAVGVNFGIIGVAWAFTIAGHLLLPIEFVMIRRLLKASFKELFGGLEPVVVATAIMAAAVGVALWSTMSWSSAIGRSSLAVGVGALAYAGAVRVVAPAMAADLLRAVRRR